MRYAVELDYYNPSYSHTETLEIIEAPEGYTADDYIKDCHDNADDDWNEALAKGIVRLVED